MYLFLPRTLTFVPKPLTLSTYIRQSDPAQKVLPVAGAGGLAVEFGVPVGQLACRHPPQGCKFHFETHVHVDPFAGSQPINPWNQRAL